MDYLAYWSHSNDKKEQAIVNRRRPICYKGTLKSFTLYPFTYEWVAFVNKYPTTKNKKNKEDINTNQKLNMDSPTWHSALVPSCEQKGQYNGVLQAEKHKFQPTPHVALKIET